MSCGSGVRILGSWRHRTTTGITLLTTLMSIRLSLLPHTNITTDADTASLVSNFLAERRALHQTRELLGAVDIERRRLDLHPPVNTCGQVGIGRLQVEILLLLGRLEQAESEAVLTLMADRKIGENEVSGGGRAVKIGHARGRDTGQDRRVRLALHAPMGDLSVLLQASIEKEAGVVVESDFLALLPR